jgi:hypothetical protein
VSPFGAAGESKYTSARIAGNRRNCGPTVEKIHALREGSGGYSNTPHSATISGLSPCVRVTHVWKPGQRADDRLTRYAKSPYPYP